MVFDEDVPLPEGAVVDVVIRNSKERFTLTPEQEERIARAVAQIERGEGVSADEFWAEVRRAR